MASIAKRTIVTTFQEITAEPTQIHYKVVAELETSGHSIKILAKFICHKE
jgi:hypothetical protein